MQMPNPRRNWTECLENVLDDYDALQHFKMWMGADDDSSEHPIRLHFAIKAFRERSKNSDLCSAPLAREIYIKFLKPRTGLCAFINPEVCEDIGQRISQLLKAPNKFMPDLFDLCFPDLYKFLRHQHALFIVSQEFIDFFNASVMGVSAKNAEFKRCDAVESTSESDAAQNSQQFKFSCGNSSTNIKNFITPTKMSHHQLSLPVNYDNGYYNSGFATTSRRAKKQHNEIKLTASSLYRSQRNRETTLGQSLVEKLYKPVNKYPYIGHATTSKNDSAVSSAFSSDANGSYSNESTRQHYMTQQLYLLHNPHQNFHSHSQSTSRAVRDEQRKLNPITNNFFMKPETQQIGAASTNSNQFDHETKEGQLAFNKALTQKLLKVVEKRESGEEVDRIAKQEIVILSEEKLSHESRQTTSTAGFVISEEDFDDGGMDAADNDVDNYFQCRMIPAAGGDSSTNNSQQQTPPIPLIMTTTNNDIVENLVFQQESLPPIPKKPNSLTGKRVSAHKSPERGAFFTANNQCFGTVKPVNLLQFAPPNPAPHNYWSTINTTNANNQHEHFPLTFPPNQLEMSQSYINSVNYVGPQREFSTGVNDEKLNPSVLKTSNLPRLMNKHHQHHQHLTQQHKSCSPERVALTLSQTGHEIFLNKSTSSVMSQSCVVCPSDQCLQGAAQQKILVLKQRYGRSSGICCNENSQQPQRMMGFAPPPGKSASASPYKDIYCDNDGDTSGIGTLTYISDASANSDLLKKQRAAVFKKARKLNAANSSLGMTALTNARETTAPRQDFGQFSNKIENECCLASKGGNAERFALPLHCSETEAQIEEGVDQHRITISYRCSNGGNSSVPTVAHVKFNKGLTFKEFRRYLSIPSRDKNQFFFKAQCEDGSAPYQLLLVNEESTILPIFEGKISAECRSLSDSD